MSFNFMAAVTVTNEEAEVEVCLHGDGGHSACPGSHSS